MENKRKQQEKSESGGNGIKSKITSESDLRKKYGLENKFVILVERNEEFENKRKDFWKN